MRVRVGTYLCPMAPVESSLGMHEGNPTVRCRITGNCCKRMRDVLLLSAGTHRTNCVVTGEEMWELMTF